jgi:hypothetical protein
VRLRAGDPGIWIVECKLKQVDLIAKPQLKVYARVMKALGVHVAGICQAVKWGSGEGRPPKVGEFPRLCAGAAEGRSRKLPYFVWQVLE